MKQINKEFRAKYEQQIAIFEKQYAEELAEERKYETVLLDSPTNKMKKKRNSPSGSPISNSGKGVEMLCRRCPTSFLLRRNIRVHF